ncbi:MAG: NAD(P)-dependent oxidoreductase [Erysipelotrichaceae bacterium]|nr:NAD(P)-dependent oxidoreductase [Erysipelotrichaceae bacterium]
MNILITGAWQNAGKHIHMIEEMGHQVTFLQYEKDQLPCTSEWVEGVICNGLFLYHSIEQFTNLKYIQLTSAGYDRVPIDYVKEHNITIFNARGVYSIPMAEYALSSALNLCKKSTFFHENQKQKKWIKNRDLKELYKQTVCIIGCGSVGTECAKRFKAFGTAIIGIDQYPYENEAFDQMYNINNLNDVLPTSDVIILTLPLTNETKHLINEERLSLLKDEAVLINISRGAVIDTDALINALINKNIYAILDVFEEEPLNEKSPLWNYENVMITPHNSFVGEHNSERLSNLIIRNLSDLK